MTDPTLQYGVIYLLAAVVAVPLAKRLGLGSVLGYLIAGVAIGPSLLGWVGDLHEARKVGEFGVVMMLFVVGLELRPRMLWRLRGPILGTGSAQVLLTAFAISGLAMLLGIDGKAAVTIGMILALSSTAIVIQSLAERNVLNTSGGQASFSVLLFQDIAVIPMLAILPWLAGAAHAGGEAHPSAIGHLPGSVQALITLGAVVGVIAAGRFLLTPLLRYIAATRLREMFTATALLVVVATAWLMNLVGLSAALGTFVAGVVLADSEYRHQLEADIDPFKGLLLGLFFITVGAGLNLAYIAAHPLLILSLVAGLMLLKFTVLTGLGTLFQMGRPSTLLFSSSLAQGSEFGFVLLGVAASLGLLGERLTEPLSATIALSMACTPMVMLGYDRFSRARATIGPVPESEPINNADNPVLLAGFGRFGHVIGRLLRSHGFGVTVLDNDPEQVELLGRFGLKAYYGDASRIDLLEMAGAQKAKLFICAVDQEDHALEIVDKVRDHFPHLTILARAGSRLHAYQLLERGINLHRRETLGSALDLATDALCELGFSAHRAHRSAQIFKRYDEGVVRQMASITGDKERYASEARRHIHILDQLLQQEQRRHLSTSEDPWDSAGPERPPAS